MKFEPTPAVRRVMQGNRKRDTKPELLLRSEVHVRGLRYRANYRLLGTRHTADLVFTRAKVAVFVDGCYWHGCPEHYKVPKTNRAYWSPKIEGNRARDRKVDAMLLDAGWAVVRVWEHDNAAEAADRVEATVRGRQVTTR